MGFLKNMHNKRELFTLAVAALLLPKAVLASGAPKAKPAESDYIVPSQITGTIMNGNRPAGIIQVDLGIYTTDARLKTLLPQLKPVLISNWRAALQDYLGRFYRPGQVPDSQMLQGLMQKAIARQIGNANARVVIQAIIAR